MRNRITQYSGDCRWRLLPERQGGTMPTVFNAANEKAVAKFLKREIGYLDIIRLIEKCMDAHQVQENPSLEEILATEQWVYSYIG